MPMGYPKWGLCRGSHPRGAHDRQSKLKVNIPKSTFLETLEKEFLRKKPCCREEGGRQEMKEWIGTTTSSKFDSEEQE